MQGKKKILKNINLEKYFLKSTEGCAAINWSKKKCYLLSSASKLEKKKGWTAGICSGLPTSATFPPTETLPPITGSSTPTIATTPGGLCRDNFFKNQAYESSKSTIIGKPSKSSSPQDCLDVCKVLIWVIRPTALTRVSFSILPRILKVVLL